MRGTPTATSLDNDEIQNADWDIQAQHNAIYAQKTMTERVCMTIGMATDTANFDSTHTATANSLGGGYLDQGTSTNPIFKRALQTAFRRIFLDTRGSVRPQDMQVVLNPATANAISLSAEITDFLKNNQFGLGQVKGGVEGQNAQWGLPDRYSDFKLVVEDTVYVPSAAQGPGTTGFGQNGYFAWPWATVAMFARPGALMAPQGGPSFSTIHLWLKEDMTVETMTDTNNRCSTTRIVNEWGKDVVAPVSGFLITSALATQPTASLEGDDWGIPPVMSPSPATSPGVSPPGISPDLQARLDLQESQVKRLLERLDGLEGENAGLKKKVQEWEMEAETRPASPPTGTPQPPRRK